MPRHYTLPCRLPLPLYSFPFLVRVYFFPFWVLFFPSFLRHVFTLLYLVERLQPSSRELKSSRRVWAMRHIRRTKLGGRFSRIPERAASPFAAQGIEIHGPSLASTGIPRFTRRSGPPRAEKEHTPPHSGTAARFVGYFRSVSFSPPFRAVSRWKHQKDVTLGEERTRLSRMYTPQRKRVQTQ